MVIIMEKEFFELYEMQSNLALEVGHNSIADWCVSVYDTRGKKLADLDKPTISIQECRRELAFAKAYAELCEHLSETRGGY